MKKYFGLIHYLGNYKRLIFLYLFFILLSVIFSVVSIAMLYPFLEIIFNSSASLANKPVSGFSSSALISQLQGILSQIIVQKGKMFALAMVCLFIIITILIKNFALYMSLRVSVPLRNGLVLDLKKRLYSKILTLPIGYFSEKRKGDLISRMTNDLTELETAVMNTLEGIWREPVTILIILGTLFYLSYQLSLMLLVLLPLAGAVIGRISKNLRKQSNEAAEIYSESLSLLEETLSGMRVIKAFTAEGMMQDKFYEVNTKLNDVKNKMSFKRDLASPLSELMGIIVLCIILWIGGSMILSNQHFSLNGSAFIMYIAIFSQIINPAKSVSSAYYNMQKGTAAVKRIEEILHAENAVTDSHNALSINGFEEEIVFKNVCFAYHDAVILDNVDLVIKKGQTLAIVGSSGSGKSTLADLVPRFHDVTSGELLIDGKNIKLFSLESLRKQVGIVTQEPILFNDTIANNIRLGSPESTMEEVEKAASIANALHFINKKENGFDYVIGDRGVKLSGGEKQRLTIARAILKNPPVLILDEATSSLDTESERLVQDAIYKMMKNRTSIVIAHRLSTIRNADEIIVLEKGKIAERGNHESLLALNGIYKRLIEMQEVK